jgi:ribosomal protein L40E
LLTSKAKKVDCLTSSSAYNALLLFPLFAVLGDTESHDQLCRRYNSRGSGVAQLCRHCNTPRNQTDNVDYDWEHILPEQVQSVIDANDKEGLKALSQHPIQNAFYEGICLGGNPRGIHGISPGEPLHVLITVIFLGG